MNATGASRRFPLAPAEQSVRGEKARTNNMVLPKGACRDRRENSNAPVVRPVNGSGFVALMRPATVEFSTAK
jgi:hypothetical protein